MNPTAKYRIIMSVEEMQTILAWPECPAELAKRMRVALLKASENLVTPAYASAPRKKTLDDHYREACARIAENIPLGEELEAKYMEYRYSNDLMTAEEEAEYEAKFLL